MVEKFSDLMQIEFMSLSYPFVSTFCSLCNTCHQFWFWGPS